MLHIVFNQEIIEFDASLLRLYRVGLLTLIKLVRYILKRLDKSTVLLTTWTQESHKYHSVLISGIN